MTDTPNATPEATDASDMEDILSSIKNTVEEETAKAEDGVLTLDAADMVDAEEGAEAPAQMEERIDLDAFTQSGDVNTEEVDINKSDILDEVVGVAANPPKPDIPEAEGDVDVENADAPIEAEPVEAAPAEESATDAGDVDIDALMAGDSADTEAPKEEAPAAEADAGDVDIDALMAGGDADTGAPKEEAPTAEADAGDVDIDALMAGGDADTEAPKEEAPPTETDAGDVDVDALMAEAPATEEAAAEPAEVEPVQTEPVQTEPTRNIELPATTTASGLQVGFPAEVLAEALRPLVKDWVDQNLQGIVEKLVQEELQKLAE